MIYNSREYARLQKRVFSISLIAWIVILLEPISSSCCAPKQLEMLLALSPAVLHAGNWGLMLIAMMAPTLVPALDHIRISSFVRRRVRSIAFFAVGYGALWIAAGKDKLDVIELLVQRGADVNARDGIWYQTPLSAAIGGKQLAAAELLIKTGAKDVDAALFTAASQGNEAMVKMILDRGKVSQDALDAALYAATTAKKETLAATLKQAGAKPLPTASERDRTAWEKLVGTYESDGGAKMVLTLKEPGLVYGGRWLKPTRPDTFVPLGSEGVRLRVERRGLLDQHLEVAGHAAIVARLRQFERGPGGDHLPIERRAAVGRRAHRPDVPAGCPRDRRRGVLREARVGGVGGTDLGPDGRRARSDGRGGWERVRPPDPDVPGARPLGADQLRVAAGRCVVTLGLCRPDPKGCVSEHDEQ
jgi:hypothetical protein